MYRSFRISRASVLIASALLASSPTFAVPGVAVTVPASATNAVSAWHDIAAATYNGKGSGNTTDEEVRPVMQADLATVALAMYDAACAIDGRYQPYAVMPRAPAAGASIDAAIGAAAHGVLRGLFPNRAEHYHAAYDKFIAALPAGPGRDKGVALGAEVAASMLARRAKDGRATAMAPFAPHSELGKYRGSIAILRYAPAIKPFTLDRVDQFRPGPPPALASAAYAADFNETKALGGANSTIRTAAQSKAALFHTEVPWTGLTRNFGRLARSSANPADAARLLAAAYTINADVTLACFEAKYFYNAWRPYTAIAEAHLDGNPATEPEAGWQSSQHTPEHPEYPAAHSCIAGGLATLLRHYYGTSQVRFTFDSTATNTTRTYPDLDSFMREGAEARIAGGMHFRFSTVAGQKLGADVAAWALRKHFGPRSSPLSVQAPIKP